VSKIAFNDIFKRSRYRTMTHVLSSTNWQFSGHTIAANNKRVEVNLQNFSSNCWNAFNVLWTTCWDYLCLNLTFSCGNFICITGYEMHSQQNLLQKFVFVQTLTRTYTGVYRGSTGNYDFYYSGFKFKTFITIIVCDFA